jgi:hypothetical protein
MQRIDRFLIPSPCYFVRHDVFLRHGAHAHCATLRMIKMIIVRSEFDQFDDFDRSSSLNRDMDLDSISTTGDTADSNEHEQKLACHFFRLLPRRFFAF